METMTQPPPEQGSSEVTTYFKDPKKPQRRRAHNSTLPAPKPRRRKSGGPGVTPSIRAAVYHRAQGQCQAGDRHHPDCPGKLTAGNWVPHHVWPREHGGPDTADNLIAVWCPGALGLNGCHGRVHAGGYQDDNETPRLLWRPARHVDYADGVERR